MNAEYSGREQLPSAQSDESLKQTKLKKKMNTEITIHPKLQHVGLTTANLDAMLEWYRKVLGLTLNDRSAVPADAQHPPPFSAVAFASNDEMHHRISFFEVSALSLDPDRSRHPRVQHVAFEYDTLDDLLGTYVRLKKLGILPVWAADQSFQTAIYYEDPDQNMLEFNVDNFEDVWTATEQLKNLPSRMFVFVDPEKMIGARRAGASPWELHERAFAGEFAPTKPYDLHSSY